MSRPKPGTQVQSEEGEDKGWGVFEMYVCVNLRNMLREVRFGGCWKGIGVGAPSPREGKKIRMDAGKKTEKNKARDKRERWDSK